MKVLRIVGILLASLIVIIVAGVGVFKATHPKTAPPSDVKIEVTPERLARGKYLAENLSSCVDCHSERDWTKLSAPVKPGTFGKGGERFDHVNAGVPGIFYAKNITPAKLSTWSDGEILRALAEGVSKDGSALFPLMPYPNLAKMTREDLYSVVAYVRSLQPIENEVPAKQVDFPVSLLSLMAPQPVTLLETAPDPNNLPEYGKYLVDAASCTDCHSQREKGEIVKATEFAGGAMFVFPNGAKLRSANITPDAETGIGNWTEETFVKRFKSFEAVAVGEKDFNTIMPWYQYKDLEERDLKAIYAYLKTLPAIKNSVVRWEPAN